MSEEEGMFNLATILKVAGTVPILLGILIIFNPTGSLVNGPHLDQYGLIIGEYVGLLAIIFGVSHWVVALYTTENLHVFARFFAVGHLSIGGMDFWNYFQGNVEHDAASMVASLFPFVLALILVMNSFTSNEDDE